MSGTRIADFDTWKANYGGASVAVMLAGTTTLASVYYDEDLTDAAPNPITLASRSMGGVNYGKFASPIYCGVAVELIINAIDQTGTIRPPLVSLDGEDASAATVRADDGSEDIPLSEILNRYVFATDYGEFLPTSSADDSASTNNATLVAAIAAVSARGGGYVLLPDGTYLYIQINIPTNVIVKGAGMDATIMQSQVGGNVVTFGGDGAGFEDITWDGVNQVGGSVGLYTKANDRTHIRRAKIKRHDTNLQAIGGRRNDWDLIIDTGVNGALLHGDLDVSGGDSFMHNRIRGVVTNCTTVGVELKYEDMPCWHNQLAIGFESNTGVALRVYGARHTELNGSWFTGNTDDIEILDGDDSAFDHENTVVGFHMEGGSISGDMAFTGRCQDVVFKAVNFEGGTYTLTSVLNNIVAVDSIEDDDVVLAGNAAKQWTRRREILGDAPSSFGLTTDAVATEGWVYQLAPGERIVLDATVVANARNSNDYAMYRILRAAHRPPSTLAYDAQTVNFTAGATLTGQTSGATALIVADSDSGATGTLSLRSIDGEFVDNETITDSSGGSALANGVLAHQNAALLGSTTQVMTAIESDASYACDFGVTAGSARVLVTGVAAKTIEWTVAVRVTTSE